METAMIIPCRFIRLTAAVAVLSTFTLYAQEQAADDAAAEDKAAEAPVAAAAEPGTTGSEAVGANADTDRMKAEAIVAEGKREKTADDYYEMARNEFIEGNFRSSSEHALKTIEILRDGKSASEDILQPQEVQEKIASARTLLSKAYYNLALEMFVEAEKSMNANMFDEAIAKCNEAVAVDPDNEEIKAYSEALIKKFQRLKEACDYNEATSYYTVDQQASERQLTIEREMRRGQQFYKTGQWAKARDHFQLVLREDPYNEMAIDYLRRCYLHLIETGRRRHNVVTLERNTEANWKRVNAIPMPSSDDRENGDEDAAQMKTDDTKNIQAKLENIVIDELSFEDQTLQDVIAILRGKSQQLDPDKNGVNIILLLLSNKPAKSADGEDGEESGEADEEESGEADEEDASSDDEGESEGDEEDGEEDESDSEDAEDSEDGDSETGGRTKYMIDYLKAQDASLLKAIELVCDAAQVSYRVEPHAVLIYDKNVPVDECEMDVFIAEKELFGLEATDGEEEESSASSSSGDSEDEAGGSSRSSSAIQRFFERRGVRFPVNSAIKYDEAVSRLIVRNTPEALARIGQILNELSNEKTNQVLVQVKFVEVALNDLEELGFEYVISRPTGGRNVWDSVTPLQPNGDLPIVMPAPYNDGRAYTLAYFPPDAGTEVLNGANVKEANRAFSLDETYKVPKNATVTLPDAPNSYYALPLNLTSIYGSAVTWGPNSPLVRNAAEDTSMFTNSMVVENDTVMSWAHKDADSGINVSAKMHALDQADSSDILSAPRVTSLANENAVIKMVTERYYPDEWSEPTLETISDGGRGIPVFQPSIPSFGDPVEEGIVLNVTPQVENGEMITLTMTPVIQQFIGWTDYSYQMPLETGGETRYYPNTLKKPIIEARTVQTTVVCSDNETIVLGGVIRDRVSMVDDQYPILGDIPLVGRLFQSKGRGSEKTSLLIFMTSRLIKPDGSPVREGQERGVPSFSY